MTRDEQIQLLAGELIKLLAVTDEPKPKPQPVQPTYQEPSVYERITGNKPITEYDLTNKLNVNVGYVRKLMRRVDEMYGTPQYRAMKSLTEELSKFIEE